MVETYSVIIRDGTLPSFLKASWMQKVKKAALWTPGPVEWTEVMWQGLTAVYKHVFSLFLCVLEVQPLIFLRSLLHTVYK